MVGEMGAAGDLVTRKTFALSGLAVLVVEREGAPWKRLMRPPELQKQGLRGSSFSLRSRPFCRDPWQSTHPMMCFERPPIPSWPNGGCGAATCRGPPTLY